LVEVQPRNLFLPWSVGARSWELYPLQSSKPRLPCCELRWQSVSTTAVPKLSRKTQHIARAEIQHLLKLALTGNVNDTPVTSLLVLVKKIRAFHLLYHPHQNHNWKGDRKSTGTESSTQQARAALVSAIGQMAATSTGAQAVLLAALG